MKTILKVIRFAFAILLSVNAIQDTSYAATPKFHCHHGGQTGKGGKVARAGILLIKKYGQNPQDYAVLVGESVQSHKNVRPGNLSAWNFPGGQVDSRKDKYTTGTAQRECGEEFHVKVPVGRKDSYLYSNFQHNAGSPIQLFFVRNDRVSATVIHSRMKKALRNPKLPHDQRETYDCRALPVQKLLDAARHVIRAGFPNPGQGGANGRNHPCYTVISRNGLPTRIDAYYLSAVAYNLKGAIHRFNALCPGANFH